MPIKNVIENMSVQNLHIPYKITLEICLSMQFYTSVFIDNSHTIIKNKTFNKIGY